MTHFITRIRRNAAKIVMATATALPGAGFAQKELPPLPEGLAGDMLAGETCVVPAGKSGEMLCDSDHVALHILVKRMADMRERGTKMPQNITLTLPVSEQVMVETQLSTAKLQAFSDAIEAAKLDKHYPVALSTRASSTAEAIGSRGSNSGLILLDIDAFNNGSVPQLITVVQSAIDKLKQKQQELAPGQLRA